VQETRFLYMILCIRSPVSEKQAIAINAKSVGILGDLEEISQVGKNGVMNV